MIQTNLQSIYEEDSYWEWYENYENQVKHFIDLIQTNQEWKYEDKIDLLKAKNDIASLGQGLLSAANITVIIKNKWDDLIKIIKNIVKNNDITNEEYVGISNIIDSICEKNQKVARNRIVATFLPNIVTTTVNESDWNYLRNKLVEEFDDYPEPTYNWLEDNKAFIKYINQKVTFNNTYHSSPFAWVIRDHYKNIDNKKMEQNQKIETFKSLLLANYNLILTGAPGTGKTFLAKQIAKAMGATYKMVQFHPSYDYTDFVEGLRPNDNCDGFLRKDGVFKKFCKAAIKNLRDSQSTKDALSKENKLKEQYDCLIQGINDGQISKITLRAGKNMNILRISDNDNIILTADTENKKEYVVSYKRLKMLSETYPTIESLNAIQNIYKSVTEVIKGCNSSAYWGVLSTLYQQNVKYTEIAVPQKQNFVFIIDEINRGEISKIFGELFYCIDAGYREDKDKVDTQYQNLVEDDDEFKDGFYIPENVYIIGTMNDIDRSVESMDFAMRRRFAWKEITAESRQSMLDEDDAWGKDANDKRQKPSQDIVEQLKIRMNNLNAAIIDKYNYGAELSNKDKIGLTKAYQIGASYFLKYALYPENSAFDDLWTNHLEGLLYEYLRGKTDIDAKIERLKQAYNDITEEHIDTK